MEGHWELLGGGGQVKVQILEAKYEAKLEFPEGQGVQNKNPSVGGVWIFSGTVPISNRSYNIVSSWYNQSTVTEIILVISDSYFPK